MKKVLLLTTILLISSCSCGAIGDVWTLSGDFSTTANPVTVGDGQWRYVQGDGTGALFTTPVSNWYWTEWGQQNAGWTNGSPYIGLLKFGTSYGSGSEANYGAGEVGAHAPYGAWFRTTTGGDFQLDAMGYNTRINDLGRITQLVVNYQIGGVWQTPVPVLVDSVANKYPANAATYSTTLTGLQAGDFIAIEMRGYTNTDFTGMDAAITQVLGAMSWELSADWSGQEVPFGLAGAWELHEGSTPGVDQNYNLYINNYMGGWDLPPGQPGWTRQGTEPWMALCKSVFSQPQVSGSSAPFDLEVGDIFGHGSWRIRWEAPFDSNVTVSGSVWGIRTVGDGRSVNFKLWENARTLAGQHTIATIVDGYPRRNNAAAFYYQFPVVEGQAVELVASGGDYAACRMTVTGEFIERNLTIQTDPPVVDTVTPHPGVNVVVDGQTVALSAQDYVNCPSTYVFDHWVGNVNDPDSANTEIVINGDQTVTAVFMPGPSCVTLTIDSNPASLGGLAPAAGEYQYPQGQTVALSAQDYINCPSTYVFDHWAGNVNAPSSSQTEIVMNGDQTVTAVFVPGPPCVTLTLDTNPSYLRGQLLPTSGECQYPQGQVVEIKAQPRYTFCPDVQEFVRWNGPVDQNPTLSSNTVTLNTDKSITAVYTDARECGDECHPIPPEGCTFNLFNLADFAAMAANWLVSSPPPNVSPGDYNQDGIVDLMDLSILAAEWLDDTDVWEIPRGLYTHYRNQYWYPLEKWNKPPIEKPVYPTENFVILDSCGAQGVQTVPANDLFLGTGRLPHSYFNLLADNGIHGALLWGYILPENPGLTQQKDQAMIDRGMNTFYIDVPDEGRWMDIQQKPDGYFHNWGYGEAPDNIADLAQWDTANYLTSTFPNCNVTLLVGGELEHVQYLTYPPTAHIFELIRQAFIQQHIDWVQMLKTNLTHPNEVLTFEQAIGTAYPISYLLKAYDMSQTKDWSRQNVEVNLANNRGASRSYDRPMMLADDWWVANGELWDTRSVEEMEQIFYLSYFSGVDYLYHEYSLFAQVGNEFWPNRWGQKYLDFGRFTTRHPTRGEPLVKTAILRGFGDTWSTLYTTYPWGDPGWRRIDDAATRDYNLLDVFFPEFGMSYFTDPYRFCTGTPFGPVDMVPWDITLEKLSDYDLVLYFGLNAIDDPQYQKLKAYVQQGGTLAIALGQLRVEGTEPRAILSAAQNDTAFLGVQINSLPQFVAGPTAILFDGSSSQTDHYYTITNVQGQVLAWTNDANNRPVVVKNMYGAGQVYLYATDFISTVDKQTNTSFFAGLADQVKLLTLSPASSWLEYTVWQKGDIYMIALFNHGRIGYPSGNGTDHGVWDGMITLDFDSFPNLSGIPLQAWRVEFADPDFDFEPLGLTEYTDNVSIPLLVDKRAEIIIGPAGLVEPGFFQ